MRVSASIISTPCLALLGANGFLGNLALNIATDISQVPGKDVTNRPISI